MNREKNYAINFTLFKMTGAYQMVDPNTKKLFGFNIFNFVIITIIIFITIVTILGLNGFFSRLTLMRTKIRKSYFYFSICFAYLLQLIKQ